MERSLKIRTALAAFVTGFAFAALVGGVGALASGNSLAVMFLLGEAGLLVGAVLYLVASGRDARHALRVGPVPTAAYPPALALGVALLIANLSATVLLGPPVRDVEFVANAVSTYERVVLAIGVAVVAPIVEEALFRGLLQGVLEQRLRPFLAIAVAAMPFALLHGPQPALFFFFWSLPVGWVTWRTGSIRPGVVVHAINNIVGVIGLLAAGTVEVESVEPGAGELVTALAVLAVTALWVVWLCRRIDRAAGRFSN
jgi:membrane protease YdiL (CAAX protease family)